MTNRPSPYRAAKKRRNLRATMRPELVPDGSGVWLNGTTAMLEYIGRSVLSKGIEPTYRDIAAHLFEQGVIGNKSISSVAIRMDYLVLCGYAQRNETTHRWRLTKKGRDFAKENLQ